MWLDASCLARAFFFAGARALLASHWAVASDSTVKLIKTTISTMAADKSVGRSEALRRSMVALIERGEPHEAHPAYWAPFVVVGEGSAVELTGAQVTTPAAPAKLLPTPVKKATQRHRPQREVPWTGEIWRKQTN